MAIISDLRDFNNQIQLVEEREENKKEIVNQGDSVIKYIPNIMKEQRQNFREIFEILDIMESRNMIKYNKVDPIQATKKDEKLEVKEVLKVTAIIFILIRVAIVLL